MATLKDALKTNLRHFRKLSGMSQVELGKKAGVSRNTIVAYEKGTGSGSLDTIANLADALGVEETDLFYPGEPPKPPEHSIEECRRRVGIDVLGAIEIMGALKAEREAGVDGPISKRLFEQCAEIQDDGDR